MADRFQSSVEVNAPASICYQYWHNFENFPNFMSHVKSVTRQGDNRWHWVVSGPMGANIEWDAVMDGDEPNRMISWHTISDSDVGTQGAVRFDEVAPDRTRITSTVQYETPAGKLGEVVARIFSNPQKMVDDDLNNFKQLVEENRLDISTVSPRAGATGGYGGPSSENIGGMGI